MADFFYTQKSGVSCNFRAKNNLSIVNIRFHLYMSLKKIAFIALALLLHPLAHGSKIKASEFGFDEHNATRAFQQAINSSYDTIIVDYQQGKPWKVGPSWFRGIRNKVIIFEPGVVLEQKEGLFTDKLAMLFRLENSSSVTILGYGATFKMNKAMLKGHPVWSEFRNSIALYDCKNIVIKGLQVDESGGDGLLISSRNATGFCENILVEDVAFTNHFRQGMSIISLKDGIFRNCTFSGTSGTYPESGADLEPNYATQHLSNILFENCSFTDNGHAGILLALTKAHGDSPPIEVCFTDSYVARNNRNKSAENNSSYWGTEIQISMTQQPDHPLQGTVKFERTLIEDFPFAAFVTKKRKMPLRYFLINSSFIIPPAV